MNDSIAAQGFSMSPPDEVRSDAAEVLCRSGAAARIAGIPVATLRVWERRYAAFNAVRSNSGQRLYTPHDIERLVLLKKLVGMGHAIGTIATQPLPSLLALATSRTDCFTDAQRQTEPASPTTLCVVGLSLARRLRSSTGRQALKWAGVELVASFDDLAQASKAASRSGFPPADVLLVHVSSLHPDAVGRVLALGQVGSQVIVVHDFGTNSATQRLRDAGVIVHHDPFSLADLAALLPRRTSTRGVVPQAGPGIAAPSPRPRFDDEALARLADISSLTECGCLQHLSRIVMQLLAVERYSAGCANLSPADAELHASLGDATRAARLLVESALERLARVEGVDLPAVRRHDAEAAEQRAEWSLQAGGTPVDALQPGPTNAVAGAARPSSSRAIRSM